MNLFFPWGWIAAWCRWCICIWLGMVVGVGFDLFGCILAVYLGAGFVGVFGVCGLLSLLGTLSLVLLRVGII